MTTTVTASMSDRAIRAEIRHKYARLVEQAEVAEARRHDPAYQSLAMRALAVCIDMRLETRCFLAREMASVNLADDAIKLFRGAIRSRRKHRKRTEETLAAYESDRGALAIYRERKHSAATAFRARVADFCPPHLAASFLRRLLRTEPVWTTMDVLLESYVPRPPPRLDRRAWDAMETSDSEADETTDAETDEGPAAPEAADADRHYTERDVFGSDCD